MRSLSGHRSSVLSVDFHPFGVLFASGSLDTNIKIWDFRKKDAIQTYKNFNKGVTTVKFSPDGKWIASGGETGEIKIWDVTAGKMVHEFSQHTNAVTGIEFHPSELIMASSSADKTVKLWDVDSLELIESTSPEATGVRALAFHPRGRHVFSALQDGLRCWAFEPFTQMDNVDVPWSKIADMSIYEHRLIGCSFHQSMVGVWVVHLDRVRPFCDAPEDYFSNALSLSRDEPLQRPPPQQPAMPAQAYQAQGRPSGGAAAAAAAAAAPSRRGGVSSVSTDSLPLPAWQQAQHAYPSARQAMVSSPRSSGEPPALPSRGPSYTQQQQQQGPAAAGYGPSSSGGSGGGHAGGKVSIAVEVGDSLMRGEVRPGQFRSMADQARAAEAEAGSRPRGGFPDVEVRAPPAGAGPTRGGGGASGPSSSSRAAAAAAAQPMMPSQQPSGWDSRTPPSSRPEPLLVDAPPAGSLSPKSDVAVIADIAGQHEQLKNVLSTRLSQLSIVRSFCTRHDTRGALSALRRAGDPAIAAPTINILMQRRDALSLDHVPDFVPVLETILSSQSEKHLQTGLEVLSVLLKAFASIIRDTCSAPANRGVDLSFEKRREKCELVRMALQGLASKLGFMSRRDDVFGRRAEDLARQIAALG